jgi:peptidoglycan/LPS O-acetylase OafA/YrhL
VLAGAGAVCHDLSVPSRATELDRFSRPRAAEGEFPCFDGIRGLAALAVVVFHAIFFSTRFEGWGGRHLSNLDVGVWVFFVTSGFLLYRPFAAAHARGAVSPAVGAYLLRRFARIYPAYWIALAFFALVVHRATIRGAENAILDVTLTYTYAGRDLARLYQGLPVAWTLVVEVSFYLLLPLYATAVRRLARHVPATTAELWGLAALAVVGVTGQVLFALDRAPVWVTVLPARLHVFALGMGLAVVVSRRWDARVQARIDRAGDAAWLWWSLALAGFAVLPAVGGMVPTNEMSAVQSVAGDVLRGLIGALVVAPAVLGANRGGAIRNLLRMRTVVFLGVVSYGLYLWHYFVLQIVQEDWLGWQLGTGNWLVVLAIALPIVVGAATASWFLVERPAIRFAKRLPVRARSAVVEPVPHAPALEQS